MVQVQDEKGSFTNKKFKDRQQRLAPGKNSTHAEFLYRQGADDMLFNDGKKNIDMSPEELKKPIEQYI